MTAVGEDKKIFPGSAVAWAKWGLGGLGGKTVKLQGVEKPYLLKQTVWNGIFSPLKLKCLSIINALYIWLLPMQPNHLPAQHKAIISTEQQLVSVSCVSAEAHVCICMCACECVHESTGTKKL